jgi:hypothetical protein
VVTGHGIRAAEVKWDEVAGGAADMGDETNAAKESKATTHRLVILQQAKPACGHQFLRKMRG